MKSLRTKQWIDWYLGGLGLFILKPIVIALGKTLKRDHSLTQNPRSIVILKLLGGGSLVIALPALLGIRRKFPQAKISLITTSAVQPFAKLLGVFDSIEIIDDRSAIRLLLSSFKVWLKTLRPDLLLDFEVYSRLSALFSIFTLALNRIGFFLESVFWRRGLYTHLVFFNRFSGTYFFYEEVGRLVGAQPTPSSEVRTYFESRLTTPRLEKRIISVGAVCSDLSRERMLSIDHWVHVFNSVEPGAEIHLLGGPGDTVWLTQLQSALSKRHTVIQQAGKLSLEQSVNVIRSSEKFYGIDSGLLHFARVLNVPCESFWGPTHPHTRIPVRNDEITHYKKIACSPCVHVSESPPCRGDNVCIKGLFSTTEPVNLPIIFYPKDQTGPW